MIALYYIEDAQFHRLKMLFHLCVYLELACNEGCGGYMHYKFIS